MSVRVEKICAWCKGKGRVKDLFAGQITCPVCHGNTRNVFTGPVRLCDNCGGSGVDPDRRTVYGEPIYCPTCGGKGWIPIDW